MRYLLFSLLFGAISFSSFSQEGFEYRQKLGFLIAHRSLMAHLPQAPAVASEFSYIYRAHDRKAWHKAYRSPLIGATLFYGSVGNNAVLGRFTGLYGFVELPIIKYKKYRLDFKFSPGLGYTNKPFDPATNPENVAIGSHLNLMMCFALKQSLRFDNYGFTFGIDMTHFSNASYKMPNLGINLPYLSLGVQKFFEDKHPEINKERINEKTPNLNFGATVLYSQKEMRPIGVGKYPVYAANVFARKYFGPKAGLEVSMDFIYKMGLLHHPSYPNPAPLDPLQIGLFVGYVQPFDRLHFIYGAGYYVRDILKPDNPFYIRLGSRYAFTPNIEGHFTLKTHYAKADYIELGLSYKFHK